MAISEVLSFKGRIPRQRYWLTSLGIVVVHLVVVFSIGAIADKSAALPVLLWTLFIGWTLLATWVKRWHDRGKSGWMVLISLIPIVGPVWTLVELGFLQGTVGTNQYGTDPLQ